MILSEQKHSYILVSVFAGGGGGGLGVRQEVFETRRDRQTDKKDIFIEINSENLVDKLITLILAP